MPFESEKQRRWMHANKPEMAKRWEKKEEALKQEGDNPTAATIRMAPIEITATKGTPDWEQAFLEFEAAEQDPRRFPTPGILQRLEDVVGEDWRNDYKDWKNMPNRAEPLKPRRPGPLISEEDKEVKIKGFELKQMIKEELIKLIKEGGMYQPGRAVSGIGRSMLVTAAGDTPEDIAREMLESGQEITEETVTQAALDAGVLDDDLPDFIDAIINTLQDDSEVNFRQAVKEALLSEMGCGGEHHGHEQHSMPMSTGLSLGGMETGAPIIVIQSSEEEKLPAETHPTRIYHKEKKPDIGIQDIIPMLLQLEGKVVQFKSKDLDKYVKRSLKRVLREAERSGFNMGSIAGSIPASTFKREDDEDDKIEEGWKDYVTDIAMAAPDIAGSVYDSYIAEPINTASRHYTGQNVAPVYAGGAREPIEAAYEGGLDLATQAATAGPRAASTVTDWASNLVNEHNDEMYDLTKGERPPPHSTGDVTRKSPDEDTEASMTPNYEVEIEQLVFDMLMSGMSEQEIMGMVEEYVQDASTYAK